MNPLSFVSNYNTTKHKPPTTTKTQQKSRWRICDLPARERKNITTEPFRARETKINIKLSISSESTLLCAVSFNIPPHSLTDWLECVTWKQRKMAGFCSALDSSGRSLKEKAHSSQAQPMSIFGLVIQSYFFYSNIAMYINAGCLSFCRNCYLRVDVYAPTNRFIWCAHAEEGEEGEKRLFI